MGRDKFRVMVLGDLPAGVGARRDSSMILSRPRWRSEVFQVGMEVWTYLGGHTVMTSLLPVSQLWDQLSKDLEKSHISEFAFILTPC